MTQPTFFPGENGLTAISVKTLKRVAPQAFRSVDKEDLEAGLWVMLEKPVPLSDPDETGFSDEWSQTNEPELAEWIAAEWDQLTVDIDGKKAVIICGSWDDEYGWVWVPAKGAWQTYAY